MKKIMPILGTSLLLGVVACTDDNLDETSTEEANEGPETGEEETNDEETGPVEGGEMVLAMPSDAVTLDPQAASDVPSNIIYTNVYETLVYQDENMEIQPGLAENYEQLDDHTWEFNLQEDVTFHDGEPFNAEAVVASLERLLDPETASPRASLFELVEDIDAVDEHTVEITTSEPFAPLPAHLSHGAASIISPAAIEADANGDVGLDTNPIGTGPFEFDNWVQGDEVTLTNNADYWDEPAYLDSLSFQVVPEQATRIGMVENGEAHFAQQIEPSNVGQVEQMENASLVTEQQLGFEYVGFNTEEEPFDDAQVRRALSMAIDKEVMLEGIYGGYGSVAESPLSDLVFGASDDLDPLSYDPEQAEELLADAGYEDGFETTIWTNDANPMRIQVAEYFQDQFAEIGVEADIQELEWGAYLDAVGEGEHDIFVLGWSTSTGDGDYGLHPNFHSDNVGADGNQTFYANEELDELIIDAREESDEETREQLYEEAEQLIIDEAPVIPTVHNDYLVAVANSVEGFVQHPSGLLLLDNVYITEEVEDSGY